jgi:hypothetical protein
MISLTSADQGPSHTTLSCQVCHNLTCLGSPHLHRSPGYFSLSSPCLQIRVFPGAIAYKRQLRGELCSILTILGPRLYNGDQSLACIPVFRFSHGAITTMLLNWPRCLLTDLIIPGSCTSTNSPASRIYLIISLTQNCLSHAVDEFNAQPLFAPLLIMSWHTGTPCPVLLPCLDAKWNSVVFPY